MLSCKLQLSLSYRPQAGRLAVSHIALIKANATLQDLNKLQQQHFPGIHYPAVIQQLFGF
jgi:hypothetical protein